jgi:hypothetical protein
MAGFDIDDLYTVSAGVLLSDYWNPFVTKHDTSSFYNWEQDNLPLYDLEERTDYLWEKLGYPTSSLPGMVLAVSSSIPTHLDVSCNFFLDLSSAIKALPEVLHMPVLIEVCASGYLGDLELDNIKCMGDGALEIINRASARVIGSDPHKTSSSDFSAVTFANDINGYGAILAISSGDYQNVVADTSCLLASSNDVEFVQDSSEGKCRGFAQVRPHLYANSIQGRHLTDSVSNTMNNLADPNRPLVNPIGQAKYPTSVVLDYTTTSLDSSCNTSYDDTLITRSKPQNNTTPAHAIITSNSLRRVHIENCDGPIYIRNFIVDPAEDKVTVPYNYSHSFDEGVVISNSSNVTLENFGVMRSRGTGLLLKNSNVDLRRGFAASRNYLHLDANTRDESYGIKSYNSTINIKSDNYVSGSEFLFNIQEHTVGLYLHNSVITGGDSFSETDNGVFCEPTVLNFFSNKTNIEAVNSEISTKGLITCYNGDKGLRAVNSTLILDGINIEANEDVGMELINSHVRYGGSNSRQSGDLMAYGAEASYLAHTPYTYQISFTSNGRHMTMHNSTFKLDDVETGIAQVDVAPFVFFANHHGSDSYKEVGHTLAPAVYCNGSLLELAHARMFSPRSSSTTLSTEFDLDIKRTVKGILIKAENNSTVDFHGSRYGATQLVGPNEMAKQRKSVGVYSGNNSTVRFMGPTFMGQCSVNAYADKNSSVEFCPHKTQEGGLAVSSWELINGLNHTMVELHSTRACLVADNGSLISMRDLGDYHTSWNRDDIGTSVSAADYGTGTDTQGYESSSYFASGGMIFLPNPDETVSYLRRYDLDPNFSNKVSPVANPHTYGVFSTPSLIGSSTYYSTFLDQPYASMSEADFSAISLGGFCIKAMNGSKVDSLNVHFVPGPNNTDKEFYSPAHESNNAGCYNLRIWNIGDGSHLNAAYCSVSGTYPGQAPYWGPRSVWQKPGTDWYTNQGRANTSAIGETAFSGINYATSGTRFGTAVKRYDPEFKNYSILDSYGESVALNTNYTLSYAAISKAKSEYLINNSLTINDYSAVGEIMRYPNGTAIQQHTDTGSLAGDYETLACRWIGMNGSNGPFNRGPFRLYFSTKPSVNYLCPSGSTPGDNTIAQVFAQGYHASGDCSAVNDEIAVLNAPDLMVVSGSFWDEVENIGFITNQDAWGFEGYYHVKDFVDPTFRNRVMLDESASNTFANAKHCSSEFNGRPALLKIYRATTTEEGEGHSPSLNEIGRGYRTSNLFDFDRRN